MHDSSPKAVPAWVHAATLLAYVVALVLAARWVRPSLWGGMCGTGSLNFFMLCALWCGVMLILAARECLSAGGSRRLALRLALAGLAPVAVPLIISRA